MTTDLAVRLLVAIEETEHRLNKAVTYSVDGGCPRCRTRISACSWDGDVPITKLYPCGHLFTDEEMVAEGLAQRTPDEARVRRCAADRQIVEECRDMIDDEPTSIAAEIDHYGAFGLAERVLRALADGYGLEVDSA